MALTLFKDSTYDLSGLVEGIDRGDIALPDIQRPFVWSSSKVRDLFDSMYRGFPVGYLLFWSTGAEVGARPVGTASKQAAPRLLIVDGQQRLTSLFAVMKGATIVRKDYTEGRIRIAFRPSDAAFSVTDAPIERDPEYIPDISVLFNGATRSLIRDFLRRLEDHRGEELSDKEKDRLDDAIDRVKDLQSYPFKVIELDSEVEEEQVADVFVRINSEGVQLNQADFILTLMSVWWDEGRTALENFTRDARRSPADRGASPFNHFLRPSPDQLLRVGVGLAFRRGRLQHVYSILRGKDLETGVMSPERREDQIRLLKAAQETALDLTNWHEFLRCLTRAGFRSARMISSENAVLYAYVLWLVGRRDFAVDLRGLREVIARWFFMAHTTGRYSSSPETQIESDLARLRPVSDGDAAGFCAALDRIVTDTLTNDYWGITLPNRLDTAAAKSPALSAYWAALNLLDAELLFSELRVVSVLDPAVNPVRNVERHHLFPKEYLRSLGIDAVSHVNTIANMSFVDWAQNAQIAASPPAEYWPVMTAGQSAERRRRQMYWHALPAGWEQLEFADFCERRRKLIADVVRDAFNRLSSDASGPAGDSRVPLRELIAADESNVVEFKSTARVNLRTDAGDDRMEHAILKTVAGFMNAEGGTLIIGVADKKSIVGLERDYATLGARGDRDGFELFVGQLVGAGISGPSASLIRAGFETVEGHDVCRLDIAAAGRPAFARPAQGSRDHSEFWVRLGNRTERLVGSEMVDYQKQHWG